MLPNILDDFDGDFWIEFNDGVCQLHVSVKLEALTIDKRETLINVAKNKKNAAANTIVGKIRAGFESIFLNDDASQISSIMTSTVQATGGYGEGLDFSYVWSLEQHRNTVSPEQTEDWDELEKSVITALADDVIVGIRGKKTDIIVIKKFA